MRCHFPQRDADWFLSAVKRKGLTGVTCRGAGQSCVVGRMSEVFGSIDNAHGSSSTWQVPPRLDWPLDTAGAFDDDFCVTVDSESFRAQATGNCIKIMKRTKKKEEDEKEIVNGSEREGEAGRERAQLEINGQKK